MTSVTANINAHEAVTGVTVGINAGSSDRTDNLTFHYWPHNQPTGEQPTLCFHPLYTGNKCMIEPITSNDTDLLTWLNANCSTSVPLDVLYAGDWWKVERGCLNLTGDAADETEVTDATFAEHLRDNSKGLVSYAKADFLTKLNTIETWGGSIGNFMGDWESPMCGAGYTYEPDTSGGNPQHADVSSQDAYDYMIANPSIHPNPPTIAGGVLQANDATKLAWNKWVRTKNVAAKKEIFYDQIIAKWPDASVSEYDEYLAKDGQTVMTGFGGEAAPGMSGNTGSPVLYWNATWNWSSVDQVVTEIEKMQLPLAPWVLHRNLAGVGQYATWTVEQHDELLRRFHDLGIRKVNYYEPN